MNLVEDEKQQTFVSNFDLIKEKSLENKVRRVVSSRTKMKSMDNDDRQSMIFLVFPLSFIHQVDVDVE